MNGWALHLVGWPWWAVAPLALVAAAGVLLLYRRELVGQPPAVRRGLLALRGAVVVILGLAFCEPTLARTRVEREAPTVLVVVDRSQSMAVCDATMAAHRRLDEAVALGLLDASAREVALRQAAAAVGTVAAQAPDLAAACERRARAGADPVAGAAATAAAEAIAAHLPRLESDAATTGPAQALVQVLRSAAAALGPPPRSDDGLVGDPAPAALAAAAALRPWRERAADLQRVLLRAQEAADAAMVNAAAPGTPLRKALDALQRLPRSVRAGRLLAQTVLPLLDERSEVRLVRLDPALDPVSEAALLRDDTGALTGETDLSGALAAAGQDADGRRLAAVLVVGDGRATAGGDPLPAARALRAAGVAVHTLGLGDDEAPRDAVVAEIGGTDEAFRGETLRLDVRWRVTGFGDRPFDLVLLRDGVEHERRRVATAGGAWSVDRFELPADRAGLLQVTARLEAAAGAAIAARDQGLERRAWTGTEFASCDALAQHAERVPPTATGRVATAAGLLNWGDRYGEVLRGWLVPPMTGDYVFTIAADDQAQVLVGTDADPASRGVVAQVAGWTGRDEYDREPGQRSRPVTLRAGQAYYLEIRHTEGSGDDHVSVGWQLPDATLERPIPAQRLLPFDGAVKPGATPATADGEAVEASLDNNAAQKSVVVHDDPLRVLLCDQSPRWDARFLVSLLERDRRVQVDRRYRQVRLPRGEHELLPLTQEALDAFDLVVLGDLRSEEFAEGDHERLHRYVERRGGCLVALAGPRGMPSGHPLGRLADLLPVSLPPQAGPAPAAATAAGVRSGSWRVRLGEGGRASPITAVLDDARLNERLWPALPPLTWVAGPVQAKPGAQVLIETGGDPALPVLAVQRVGAGRVIYLGSDETWRWRDRLGDRVHQTFWQQVVRWGLGVRLRGRDPRLQVALDRSLISPGETVELRVRLRDRDGRPAATAPEARLAQLDDRGQVVPGTAAHLALAAVAGADGMWQRSLADLGTGRWRVTVQTQEDGAPALIEERDLHVRAHRNREAIDLTADPALLRRLAEEGGGTFAGPEGAAAQAEAIATTAKPRWNERRRVWSLWDNYALLVLVSGLLLAEWMWRKRRGLA